MEKGSIKCRNSNFEVLRIISMLGIIAGHLTIQSGILNTNSNNKYCAMILGGAFGIADNIFILISAYFLTNMKFSPKRILKIYLELWTCTVPLTILMICIKNSGIGVKDIVRGLFPYSGSPLWFATCYISLLAFSPFLNKLLNNKKITKKILCLLFFINVIPSTFLLRNDFFYSGEIVYFCFIYLLVGYFRRYPLKNRKNIHGSIFLFIAIVIYVILICFYFMMDSLKEKSGIIMQLCKEYSLEMYFIKRYHTLPALICSLCVFIFVKKIKTNNNKYINFISRGVFSAYIIHQTPAFAPFMWKNLLKVNEWIYSKYYLIYYILSVLMIFLVGSLIGIWKKKLIDPLIEKSKIYNKCLSRLEKFYNIED